MKRFIVIKEQNGARVSHGTLIYSEKEELCFTSHALDAALDAKYLVALDGDVQTARLVVSIDERFVSAPGCAVQSIAPYVYQLEFEATP